MGTGHGQHSLWDAQWAGVRPLWSSLKEEDTVSPVVTIPGRMWGYGWVSENTSNVLLMSDLWHWWISCECDGPSRGWAPGWCPWYQRPALHCGYPVLAASSVAKYLRDGCPPCALSSNSYRMGQDIATSIYVKHLSVYQLESHLEMEKQLNCLRNVVYSRILYLLFTWILVGLIHNLLGLLNSF